MWGWGGGGGLRLWERTGLSPAAVPVASGGGAGLGAGGARRHLGPRPAAAELGSSAGLSDASLRLAAASRNASMPFCNFCLLLARRHIEIMCSLGELLCTLRQFLRALRQILGALSDLLPVLGNLALDGTVLLLQIGNLPLQISHLMLK